MGRNSDRWKDLRSKLDSIQGLNTYVEPVNADIVRSPFAIIRLEEIKNILTTSQGCSQFDGIKVNFKVGVYSIRDNEEEQSDNVCLALDLFDSIQKVVPINTDRANADSASNVYAKNSNCYVIEYSGYYNYS